MGFFQRVFHRGSKQDQAEGGAAGKAKQRSGRGNLQSIDTVTEQRDDLAQFSELNPVLVGGQLSPIAEEATLLSKASSSLWGPPMMPPPAREAAFHGPPRFDWIDIETNAAIKIQSIYRRNKVMERMEQRGESTSAIRNRKRRRKASRNLAASEDTPSMFACCAMGLAFGDATEEDDIAYRQLQNKQYEERILQQEMREDEIRQRYLRERGVGVGVGKILEEIEVIE